MPSRAMLLACALAPTASSALAQEAVTPAEASAIATDAYVYGYPLITMDTTRRVMTNTARPEGTHAPMGQFANVRAYPDAAFRDVTAPNADTLYSIAWLDLATEPYVVSIPDEDGRYFLMPMLSGWTDVFAAPGKRTTGTKAQTYAVTGPNWSGTLPEGMKELKSPTAMVWIVARTYCTGTPEDYEAVHAIQDAYKLVPLSAYGKPYTPPTGKVDPAIDMKTPVRAQVNGMKAGEYFSLLAKLMADNPPAEADAAIVARMARIGIVPGEAFDPSKLPAEVADAIDAAPADGWKAIMAQEPISTTQVNGWSWFTKTGRYLGDYANRAMVTAIGLGANLPQDAIYPFTSVDGDGAKLNGSNRYVVHFAKGQTPPVEGFWSITMYDPSYFFVANPLNRYTVSPRDDLKANADGSIDLYFQHDSPGAGKASNWLPAPSGDFVLMLRMYWPEDAVIDGTWKPPVVKRVP